MSARRRRSRETDQISSRVIKKMTGEEIYGLIPTDGVAGMESAVTSDAGDDGPRQLDDEAEQERIASYVARMCKELAGMAGEAEMLGLAYFLRMACLEAEDQAEAVALRRRRRDKKKN
jgi:hypothetical protein